MSRATITAHFWELSRRQQRRLIRHNLLKVLELVTQGEIGPGKTEADVEPGMSKGEVGPEDFAQELALRLSQMKVPVLFVNGRFKSADDRERFRLAERKTFLELIGPYRWRKRRERIVSRSDPRWEINPELPGGRRLHRYAREFLHHAAQETSENREEIERVGLMDLIFSVLHDYPEPAVQAAMGHLTNTDAARELGVRKSKAIQLINEVKSKLSELLDGD